MTTGSRIDVFIPCYNYGRYLRRAVESALQPDAPPVRILIIDDASTDETPAVAARLAARYPNVSYIRHAFNVGHIGTYNEGLNWARSELFQFLSADDLLAPGSLRRAAALFDAHPEVGMVYGRTRSFRADPPAPAPEQPYTTAVIDGGTFLRQAARFAGNPIACPAAVMVRTALQHALGGYLHELPHAGDLEMWLRFAAHAGVGVLDIDQGFYRRHDTNMSVGYQGIRDYEQRLLAWEVLCERCRHLIPDHADLLRTVRRSLAAEIFWTCAAAFDRRDLLDFTGLLGLAVRLDPALRRSKSWWNFRVKRLMGPALAACAVSISEALTARPVATLTLDHSRKGQ